MQLRINQPHAAEARNYSRDGAMRADGNCGRQKNYEPNSFDGPMQSDQMLWAPIEVRGLTGNYPPEHHRDDDDFVQAGDLYSLMDEPEKARLVSNIAASLSRVRKDDIIARSIENFRRANADYGARVARAVRDAANTAKEPRPRTNDPGVSR
jgi:catalase